MNPYEIPDTSSPYAMGSGEARRFLELVAPRAGAANFFVAAERYHKAPTQENGSRLVDALQTMYGADGGALDDDITELSGRIVEGVGTDNELRRAAVAEGSLDPGSADKVIGVSELMAGRVRNTSNGTLLLEAALNFPKEVQRAHGIALAERGVPDRTIRSLGLGGLS